MGIRERIRADYEDFKKGWGEADADVDSFEETLPASVNFVGKTFGAALRVTLFGFLLARPGVPFLPHHNTGALVLTVVAGVIVTPPVHRIDKSFALYTAVIATLLMTVVIRMDRPTTSMVLIGAFVAAVARAADNYPLIYGMVGTMAVGGVALEAFDWNPFHNSATNQTLLPVSGRAAQGDPTGGRAVPFEGEGGRVGARRSGSGGAGAHRARAARRGLASRDGDDVASRSGVDDRQQGRVVVCGVRRARGAHRTAPNARRAAVSR